MPAPHYEPSSNNDRRALARALEWIDSLATGVGPRRPTSMQECRAAELVEGELRAVGIDVGLEGFRGYSSFGQPFLIMLGLAALPSLLPARRRRWRGSIALLAAALLAGEGSLRAPVLSDFISRKRSQNVVATIEPRGEVERTIVLSCHLDTSRSGLMFDPRFVGYLGPWISLQSLAVLAGAPLEWLAGGTRGGRAALGGLRLVPLAGIALLGQRELWGVEVQGANDNASGCAVVATLATEVARNPPASTRVIALFTGCEESGMLGSRQTGFNEMADGLRERERVRELFGQHVGEDVAREALEAGTELGGEVREVAVLFVDVVGSTEIAVERPATEVVDLLNRFFGIVVEVIGDHGGWVNKFEGDAALAIFGAPRPLDDAAGCALAAGRALSERLDAEIADARAGIGISHGRVVAGNIGSQSRLEYTVIGDAVNEAARLTELAKDRAPMLVASGSALEAAGERERDNWDREEEVKLRGRGEATVLALPIDAESRR